MDGDGKAPQVENSGQRQEQRKRNQTEFHCDAARAAIPYPAHHFTSITTTVCCTVLLGHPETLRAVSPVIVIVYPIMLVQVLPTIGFPCQLMSAVGEYM